MFKANDSGIFGGGRANGAPFEAPKRRRPRYVAFTSLRPIRRAPAAMTMNAIPKRDLRFVEEEPDLVIEKDPYTGRSEGVIRFKPEKVGRFPGEIDFTPKRVLTYPGHPSPDIRPLGPYELPDYSSGHPSAAGLSWIGADAPAEGAKPSFWDSILKTGKELLPEAKKVYDKYRSGRKKKLVPALTNQMTQEPPRTQEPPSPVRTPPTEPPKGMSGTTLALLIAGGVLVLGMSAILLLRK